MTQNRYSRPRINIIHPKVLFEVFCIKIERFVKFVFIQLQAATNLLIREHMHKNNYRNWGNKWVYQVHYHLFQSLMNTVPFTIDKIAITNKTKINCRNPHYLLNLQIFHSVLDFSFYYISIDLTLNQRYLYLEQINI